MANSYVLDGVKAARESTGLSLDALAAKAGILSRTLASIEAKACGVRRKVLLDVAYAINASNPKSHFDAKPVLAVGVPVKHGNSVSKRFPKNIRVEFTKKRNRSVRAA